MKRSAWVDELPPRVRIALFHCLETEGPEVVWERLTMRRPRLPISIERRAEVAARDAGRCRYCGVTAHEHGRQLVIEHVIPLTKNGTDNLDNLVLACWTCNARKGTKIGENCSDCGQLTFPGNQAHLCPIEHCVRCAGHPGKHRDSTGWRWHTMSELAAPGSV
jgi:hypothetical protein